MQSLYIPWHFKWVASTSYLLKFEHFEKTKKNHTAKNKTMKFLQKLQQSNAVVRNWIWPFAHFSFHFMIIFYILFSWMRRLVLGNMFTAAHKAYLKVVFLSPVSQSYRDFTSLKKIVKKWKRRKSAVRNQFLYTTFAFVCSMKMNKVLNTENNVDVVKRQFPDKQKRSSFCLLCHEFGTWTEKIRRKNDEFSFYWRISCAK